MKEIQAINDHVIVEVVMPKEDITEGGIVVPLNVKMEPQTYGEVISVGELVNTVKIGDILAFAKFGGQDIILNGKIIKVLKLGEIYGIILG
jgi:co-chaperonin GroES (HSP10)